MSRIEPPLPGDQRPPPRPSGPSSPPVPPPFGWLLLDLAAYTLPALLLVAAIDYTAWAAWWI